MFRIYQSIFVIVFSMLLSVAQAQTGFSEKVKLELKNDLYPVSSLLPGYTRPIIKQPAFAVAEFRVSSDQYHYWSRVLSEVIRSRIQFVPQSPLYMPALFYTHVDAGIAEAQDRPLLTDTKSFNNLRHSLGIETVLTGSIKINGKNIELGAELVSTKNGSMLNKRNWVFPMAEASETVIEVSRWVYQSLGVTLSNEQLSYLGDRTTLPDAAIEDIVKQYPEIYLAQGPLKRDKIKKLFEQYPHFALVAIYALQTRVYARNLDEVYQNLDFYEEVEAVFPDNSGVVLASYQAMEIEMLPKHKLSRRLDKMKLWVSRNYQDPTIIINYADVLVKSGNTLDAIALLLEAVEVWPQQYRAWWSLGWALNSHAWQVRGDSFWKDVPEKAKEVYKTFSEFAYESIDTALKLNPLNGKLWSMKINTLGSRDGFSEEMINIFDQAVLVEPGYPDIYKNALNYSLRRWGGNALARKHIIETAEKNNPGSPWVERMKREHAVELESWEDQLGTSPAAKFIKELLDHPYAKWIAIISGGAILLLVFFIGRKSAFAEIYEIDEVEDENLINDKVKSSGVEPFKPKY